MKKLLFFAIVFASFSISAYSQVNPHAIGARLVGNSDILGAEITYQHGISDANRVEVDLGWGSNTHHHRINVTGIYHWDWNITAGLNWYVGPGLALGMYKYDYINDTYINLGLGGQLGLEYDFTSLGTPIMISIDGRPMWDFNGSNDYKGFGWNAAFSVRYTF